MNTGRYSLIIADSHPIYRQGIKTILSPMSDNIEIVSEAESSESILNQMDYMSPDILILDMLLPGLDSFSLVKEIASNHPRTKILVISNLDDHAYSEELIYLGACAFLKKDNLEGSLLIAIESVMLGKIFVSSVLANHSITKISDDIAVSEKLSNLDLSEVRILEKVAVNMNHIDIAHDLSLSYQFVTSTLLDLCKRLELQPAQLQVFAKANIQRLNSA